MLAFLITLTREEEIGMRANPSFSTNLIALFECQLLTLVLCAGQRACGR